MISIRTILSLFLLFALFQSCDFSTQNEQEAAESAEITQDIPEEDAEPPTPLHRQLLVSLTPDWNAVNGTLYPYQWQDGMWVLAQAPIPMVVGKKGMAWGRGIEDYRHLRGPIKKEGDKKSPAGVFQLGTAFGYADADNASFVKAKYTHVRETTMCIEDGESAHYNQIVDEASTQADWSSTDHMLRKDDLYEWGMFVLHNQPEPAVGDGSCIFLHVWRQNDSGTAGCTAMDKEKMRDLLSWIDPEQSPLMIQVPGLVYEQFRGEYNLPAL